MTEKKQILKSASVITLVSMVSRILGYIRDQRIFLLLGTSVTADSFVIAYSIPSLLRRLVGEGSMTASFIPVFSGYLAERSKKEVWEFANRLFWTVALVLAVVMMLGVVFSPQLIRLLTLFGKNPAHWEEAVYLNRIIFPYVFFIGLAALAMAILNSFHVFGPPAATPILLNLSIILFSIAAVWHWFGNPAVSLGVGVIVGGALQFLMQVPLLLKRGMRFHFGISFRHPGVRAVGRLMAPGFFGIGIFQVNFLVDRIFATSRRMPEGSVASLYLADRVMELVLGGYAIAVATAILPMMSHQVVAGDYEAVKRTFSFAMRIVTFITVPAAVGLILLREPIIQVLFQHGRFVAESTRLTARALLYYSVGLPAFAGVKLIVPAYYSGKDTRTPALVAGYALALNLVLNTVFLLYLFPKLQNGGPALATSIAAYFNLLTLLILFRHRHGRIGAGEILRSMSRVAGAAALMGFACWAMLRIFHFSWYGRLLPQVGLLIAMILGAVGLYLGVAWLLRSPEIAEVYGVAFRRGSENRAAGVLGG